ncbi:MAG: ribosome biogenesis/translation initiation ATPase RLI [Nanoarchaeota archaeon]|nr:ribosome biogenesis/translation initiation ATPase RLI [Nanoarchaeota archaeon]
MAKRICVVEREKCHPTKCGDYLCKKLCPVNRTGKDCITVNEDDKKVRIDESLCTGCGICPKRCPFGALHIVNLPEALEKDPIHRYGENQFELFSLPTPVFGKVVGIVGRNAVGKSTAIKILAGVLKPNLGQVGGEADFKDLIDYFKGSEIQTFLEKVRDGEIRISYKPQQVDLIPKKFAGKVGDLLRGVNETGEMDKIVSELDLGNILDRKLREISGGELQRVAIAATVLKKANLYIFDEPTSYMDIKQRLKVSKFIRGLAKADTAVLVIEHDLIILDYMTDLVHIMYGREGVYGIVSGLKSTREGINTFLEGYLREENIRFRDHTIKFERVPTVDRGGSMVLCSWKDVEKRLDSFSLKAKGGEIFKNDVIGVLGENGIGKTSFVKILAGVLEADKGSVGYEVTVAYKPQYLEAESEATVLEVLQEAISKYNNQIIKPLNIPRLFMKKLNQLSGGELQRVAIAKTLAEEAGLFLLDEPSAYLDVEQRLLISKIIKQVAEEREVTVLVVDHDLLFLDYLSNKLMVFDGEPAISGEAKGPFKMEEGMNMFLKDLGITFRRDVNSNRPRANKVNSVKDREQKKEGKYYYS